MAKVSFSQYSMWSACPHQYQLKYIDKKSISTSSIHLVFGTSFHETLQHYLDVMYNVSKKQADEINLDMLLLERLKANFIKEKENSGVAPCTQLELEEFFGDGRRILVWFIKHISKFYSKSGYKLLGIEIELSANVKPGVEFTGFIDVVLKDVADDSIIIIDLKTSTRGWNQYQKADKIKSAQLLIYKKFYSDLYQIPLSKIKVEFQIFRRKLSEDTPFPTPHVSKHIPANGPPSVARAYDEFMEFINSVFDDEGKYRDAVYPKTPGNNKKNCKYCEFNERKLCDGKETK